MRAVPGQDGGDVGGDVEAHDDHEPAERAGADHRGQPGRGEHAGFTDAARDPGKRTLSGQTAGAHAATATTGARPAPGRSTLAGAAAAGEDHGDFTAALAAANDRRRALAAALLRGTRVDVQRAAAALDTALDRVRAGLHGVPPRAESLHAAVDFVHHVQPLVERARAGAAQLERMGRQFGADIDHVALHADSPVAGGATALARGDEIHFAPGVYQPGGDDHVHVLAHELAHVIQQRGRGAPGGRPALEAEADHAATRVARGQSASVALTAPAGEYHYTDAAGNALPDPMDVTWNGDPFHLEFSVDATQSSPRMVCTVRYTGPHPIDGRSVTDPATKAMRIDCMVAATKLVATVRGQSATGVDIAPYSDPRHTIHITDTADVDTAGKGGRKHHIEMKLDGLSGDDALFYVRDPAAKAGDLAPQAPVAQPGTTPEMWNIGNSATWEGDVDGDGDQYKELHLTLKNPAPNARIATPATKVEVTITQIATKTSVTRTIELPAHAVAAARLGPIVIQSCDGGRPTLVDLFDPGAGPSPQLRIDPPASTNGKTTYHVQVAGTAFDAPFPLATSHTVFTPGTAQVTGNIVNVDIALGAYHDPFRLTIQPRAGNKAVFGLSQLEGGEIAGAFGAELTLAGPLRFKQLLTGATSLGIDLDGDDKPDLMLYDELTSPTVGSNAKTEVNRNHEVRIVGAAIGGERTFRFRVRDASAMRDGGSGEADKIAGSNGVAVGDMNALEPNATADQQLDSYENAMMMERKHAVPAILSAPAFAAWVALSQSMIRLTAQKSPVDPTLQQAAAGQADAFFKLISAETQSHASTLVNPYAASMLGSSGAGPELAGQLRAGHWNQAFASYRTMTTGLDKWIVDRTREVKGKHSTDAQRVELLAGRRREIADLTATGAQPVVAVFQPDQKFKNENGYVSQIPLSLFYWKDGGTWRLKNLTNPEKTYEVSVDATADDGASLQALLAKLDDPDRLPGGLIHYDIPGKAAGEVPVTDRLTWHKALTYLGLAIAAVGVTMATFGTGTVAIAGAWVMAGSAVLGGAAAALDLADKAKHKDLDATSAAIDVLQIVGSLAGASALASGRITLAASDVAVGSRWTGAWARLAVMSSKIHLPASKIAAGADVLSFVVITDQMAHQLDEIEARTGDDPGAKSQAKLRLLIQFATLGTMASLSLKGLLPGWSRQRTLVLSPGPDGMPVATLALGADSTVVDAQTAIALAKQARGETLQASEKEMVAKAKSFGDMRIADQAATEFAIKNGPASHQGVPISISRTSAEYQKMLAALNAEPVVGGGKGVGDREIVADTFFAVTEKGVKPKFATGDAGVYKPLAKRANIDARTLTASDGTTSTIPKEYPNGFDVTIDGRTITVIAIPKAPKPPKAP